MLSFACGSEQGGHCSERLGGRHCALEKKAQKRKSFPGWSAPSGFVAVRDSTPHGLGFDKTECMELTQAKDVLLKILVQARCADGGNGAAPYLAHWSRGVTLDKGNRCD